MWKYTNISYTNEPNQTACPPTYHANISQFLKKFLENSNNSRSQQTEMLHLKMRWATIFGIHIKIINLSNCYQDLRLLWWMFAAVLDAMHCVVFISLCFVFFCSDFFGWNNIVVFAVVIFSFVRLFYQLNCKFFIRLTKLNPQLTY